MKYMTFGIRDFIRVPRPAARTTIAVFLLVIDGRSEAGKP